MTKQKHFYLLRGLIRESRHWGDFPDLLLQSFPGAKASTIDIPGAGAYFKTPSPLSVKKMVEIMRQDYLRQRSENEDCILVAISLGGMVAAQWLKDFPQDFNRVVLVNTSYGGISGLFERLKPSALMYLLKVPILKGRTKEAHILRLVSNHNNVFDKTLDLWEQIQKERPVSLSNTIRQLTAGGLFRIGNFTPSLPILILAGQNDRMVSVNCSRAIAEKWKAKIEEHPTAGHDLSADDPVWMIQMIARFVKESSTV